MVTYVETLCGIAAIFVVLYYYGVCHFDFWKKRNIPGPPPIPFFGNTKDLVFAKVPEGIFYKKFYDEYRGESMLGLFKGKTPLLILRDPELIKDVLIKEFTKFANRSFRVFEKTEPMSSHLLNLKVEIWRPIRSKLSPLFTPRKLKDMFPLILECATCFEKKLDEVMEKEEIMNCTELNSRYTMDVIGSCVLGIEVNAITNKNNEFHEIGKSIFESNLENVLRHIARQYLPEIYDLLGYVVPEKKLSTFFTKLVHDTIKYRKENNIHRPDVINLFMQLQEHPEKMETIQLTDTFLAAQSFVLFGAGFETSSTTMSNALYELALNQDIQTKLREEISEYLRVNNGEIKYDEIKKLSYLDKVFKETLRIYPIIPIVIRKATADHTFKGTELSIPKDTLVGIPIYAIHHDADVYPNPMKYDPDRFREDLVAARHSMCFIPFADGPRHCIGSNLAYSQIKVGLITIIRKYKVEVCEKTMIPYEYDPRSMLMSPKEEIYLKIMKL